MEEKDMIQLPENAFRELKKDEQYEPVMSPNNVYPEVNAWSVTWGIIMAVLFSAAAAYLGLKVGQVFEAAIPIAIIASIVAVGVHTGAEKAGELSLQWAMLTGGGAMLGTIIAGGHPLTVLVALIAAPFTGLTPLIGVGFFTALTQVYMRPPRVSEMETLTDDIWQVKRWWKNRVTRVILCFLCPGIPAIIGKILAIFKIYQAF